MRCRDGGAGCGTRERDATHVTSPGGGGEPSRCTKTACRSDRSVEGVKPEMPRGAPSWRGASADAPGPGDPGPPGVIVRAVRRDPDNASSRRVTPLVLRGRKETGPPRARPKGGAGIALALHSYTQERWARERHPLPPVRPQGRGAPVFQPARVALGPGMRGGERRKFLLYCLPRSRTMLSAPPSARPEDLEEDRV